MVNDELLPGSRGFSEILRIMASKALAAAASALPTVHALQSLSDQQHDLLQQFVKAVLTHGNRTVSGGDALDVLSTSLFWVWHSPSLSSLLPAIFGLRAMIPFSLGTIFPAGGPAIVVPLSKEATPIGVHFTATALGGGLIDPPGGDAVAAAEGIKHDIDRLRRVSLVARIEATTKYAVYNAEVGTEVPMFTVGATYRCSLAVALSRLLSAEERPGRAEIGCVELCERPRIHFVLLETNTQGGTK